MREFQSSAVVERELGSDWHVHIPVLVNQAGARRDIWDYTLNGQGQIKDEIAVVNKSLCFSDRRDILGIQVIGAEGHRVLHSKERNEASAKPESVNRAVIQRRFCPLIINRAWHDSSHEKCEVGRM